MGAGDGAGGDEGVDFFLRESEGCGAAVANVGSGVNHGPLVKAVAGEERRAGLGELEKIVDPEESLAAFCGEEGGIDGDGIVLPPVVFRGEIVGGVGVEGDSESGVPFFEAAEGVGIVGVEEVEDGVFFVARLTDPHGEGDLFDLFSMLKGVRLPSGSAENIGGIGLHGLQRIRVSSGIHSSSLERVTTLARLGGPETEGVEQLRRRKHSDQAPGYQRLRRIRLKPPRAQRSALVGSGTDAEPVVNEMLSVVPDGVVQEVDDVRSGINPRAVRVVFGAVAV